MDSNETLMARELFHQIMQTRRSLHAGLADVLDDAPRCHFDMLHRLYTIIRRSGRDGAVPVSELTCRMYDSPQAVSRALRILEKDGLIQRTADPEDRRKTIVRLTEEGYRAHERCEQAVTAYAFAVARRMSPETLRSFTQDLVLFARAVEEENEARRAGKDD